MSSSLFIWVKIDRVFQYPEPRWNADHSRNLNFAVYRIYIVLYVFQNGLISSKEIQEQIDIVQLIDEKMTRVGFQDEANEIEQVIRGAESWHCAFQELLVIC